MSIIHMIKEKIENNWICDETPSGILLISKDGKCSIHIASERYPIERADEFMKEVLREKIRNTGGKPTWKRYNDEPLVGYMAIWDGDVVRANIVVRLRGSDEILLISSFYDEKRCLKKFMKNLKNMLPKNSLYRISIQ